MSPREFLLVVEDDEDIRDSLCSLLEDEGHEVVGVSNGAEALEALRAHGRPCLILLDLMMPVMDGVEFRARQLADPNIADIPVVVITAAGRLATNTISAQRVLAKPVKAEVILRAVQDYC